MSIDPNTTQPMRLFQPDKLNPPRGFQPLPAHLRQAALALEIGAGKGKHALQHALDNPNLHLVAIERTKNKYTAFANALRHALSEQSGSDQNSGDKQLNKGTQTATQITVGNLTAIHADAIAWVVHALPPACLQQVYLLYPNPEPHNPNQQWLNMPFFEFLLSRMQDQASIVLASNIGDYIDQAQKQAIWHWQLPCVRHRVAADANRTHFESKYLARGETCWQLIISKPAGYCTRFDNWLHADMV